MLELTCGVLDPLTGLKNAVVVHWRCSRTLLSFVCHSAACLAMYGNYPGAGYAGPTGANYAGYHGGPMMGSAPMRPQPHRMIPGMDPATGVVWPGGKRPPGPIVKAGNLVKDITIPVLKQALSKWGVEGIKEVLLADSRFGQVALFLFKEVEQAQLMMMAQGVEVEGRPLMLEFLPATGNAKPEKKSNREASRATELIKDKTTSIAIALSRRVSLQCPRLVTCLQQMLPCSEEKGDTVCSKHDTKIQASKMLACHPLPSSSQSV
eukprot:s4985_g3.t1